MVPVKSIALSCFFFSQQTLLAQFPHHTKPGKSNKTGIVVYMQMLESDRFGTFSGLCQQVAVVEAEVTVDVEEVE